VPASADPDEWLVVVIGPGGGLPDFNLRGGRSFTAALKEYLDEDARQGLLLRDPDLGPVTFTPRQRSS